MNTLTTLVWNVNVADLNKYKMGFLDTLQEIIYLFGGTYYSYYFKLNWYIECIWKTQQYRM